MSIFRLVILIAPLSVIAGTGCSDSITVAEVEGVVTLDGQPLDEILVEFWPESEGFRSVGTTDSEGRFKLTTDDGKQKGASIGSHKVVLHDVGIFGGKFLGRAGEEVDLAEGKKPRIAGSYSSPETTNLSAIVDPNKKNECKFKVEGFSQED